MLEPVKAAFGNFLGRFYDSLVPTTRTLETYVRRGLSKSIVWAPARMIDAAEDMLAAWQRNDTNDGTTTPPEMPVIVAAIAKDYLPSGRDYTRQIAEPVMVTLPNDPKERAFGVRALAGDVRAQLAVFAHDEPAARSLASQFLLFLDAQQNRRFFALYSFAGQSLPWPVQIETPDAPAMSIATEARNLTVLAIDLTLKAQIPLFDAPGAGQPNDGKGIPGSLDPAGYPLVREVQVESCTQEPRGTTQLRSYTVEE